MKQKNIIAWKLVRVAYGFYGYDKRMKRMVSLIRRDDKDRVEYKFGEWTKPNKDATNPFLFVFRTRKDARKWRVTKNDERVLKVLATNLTDERVGKSISFGDNEKVFNEHLLDVPGTMFADAVKIVGRG